MRQAVGSDKRQAGKNMPICADLEDLLIQHDHLNVDSAKTKISVLLDLCIRNALIVHTIHQCIDGGT